MEFKAEDRVIVALDVSTAGEAYGLATALEGAIVKVGFQLFSAVGPSVVRGLIDLGCRVFLDLKFHDIPNTVAKASIEATEMGVWAFNVHTSGGISMMQAAYDAAHDRAYKLKIRMPHVLAVTVLTSLNSFDLETMVGMPGISVPKMVVGLARMAGEANLSGVIASPLEIAHLKNDWIGSEKLQNMMIVTPGIRAKNAPPDDQKRTMSAREAIRAGADCIVIGRPITGAERIRVAYEDILNEVHAALVDVPIHE